MSHSSRRVYESKEVHSNRNIVSSSSNQQISSYQYSAAENSSFRNGNTYSRTERRYQNVPQTETNLEWQAIGKSLVYRNGGDMQQLLQHKNILLDLINKFDNSEKVVIEGRQRDDFNRRLLLLESEIDGLLRRKILFQSPDYEGGTRQLDYTGLLNEKENQIIQLEKKIQNLQERLRRQQGRQTELQNQILFLNEQLKRKNEIIEGKDRSLAQEVAFSKEMASIIESIRRSSSSRNILQDLVVPSLEISEIKASARKVTQSRNSSSEVIKLIREFQTASNKDNKFSSENIIEGWIMGLPRDSPLKQKLVEGERKVKQERKYAEMEEKFSLAGEIYSQQLQRLKAQNPNIKIQVDDQIFSALRSSNSSAMKVDNVIQIQKRVEKTVQVPVQDARTKHLIHLLATNYKKMFTKYPKLYDEMDSRLAEFFSQELIDVMEVDQLDRIVEVVKYVPQVVKVENVYAYSSEKSRKVEFHLRVLIKALLQEMEKMKAKSGVVPQIDEGVVGMIRQEIMDVVDVDDILKVYRVTPKIVEVEKIVEKVVEKIVEVPKIVQVQRKVQTPVQVKKYEVVENTVNVPIEVPKIQTLVIQKLVQVPKMVEKIIQVPQIIEKVVQVIKEVPKIVQVEKIIQKPVEVDRYREIQKEVVVPITQYRDVELVRQKIVPTKEIIEKSIPVDQIIEKIVEVKVEVPKIVEVQKIVQKIVERVQYVPAPDVRNHIEIRYEPVDRIVEKVVPIIQTVEQIVQVPQIVQKIVEVHDVIEKPIQVEVIREKVVYRDRIKEIEKIVEKPVVEYRTIEKEVEKIVQVPLIHQVIKIEREVIEKPIVEVVEKIVHKEVEIQKPKILYQDRIKQVEKIINHFIREPEVVHITEDRIVPVEKIVERIKTVPTIVEKIIQKMVEVPKVVQVQKIVQKVVVVPRVIEKVVQVPQIIEKIVERIQTVPEIHQIQKIVHVPVTQQKVIEIQVPRNIYIEVQRPVEVTKEVMVRDQIYKENAKIHEVTNERVVVQTKEVPRTLEVEKIVTNIVEQPRPIEITRDIIVPVEIEVPVDRIVEKMVPVEHVHREVEQVDKVREKIVAIKTEDVKVVEVEKLIDNIIIQQRVKEVQKIVPYMQEKIVQVEKVKEKIVPVERVIQEIKEVKQIVEKVVDRVAEIPKVYEVEKLVEKRVDIPKIIQVQKIVPEIIRVNKYIENIVEKIVQVPVLIQQLKEIQVQREKVVAVNTESTNVVQVDRAIEKEVIVEKLKQVTNNIHLIENTLQIVDRIIERDLDPVLVTEERIIEVPQIIEKIVEKVVVMPQIVEVLKYVHEIAQKETLGVAVGAEVGIQQRKYKQMGGNLKTQLEALIVELRRLKSSNPSLRVQIQLIEKFLGQFETFLLYPRIHQIIQEKEVEKVVEKDRPVLVPFESENNLRTQLSKSILIQKLISELKSIKQQNPSLKFNNLDEDISLIFLSQLGQSSKFSHENFNKQLEEFSYSVQRKFSEMGGWSSDHQLMLNSFLQERFLMANVVKNSNQTIKKTKAISDKRLEELRKVKEERDKMAAALKNLKELMPGIMSLAQKQQNRSMQTQIQTIITSINSMMVGDFFKGEPTRKLGQLVLDARVESMLRQKDDLILQLRERLKKQSSTKESSYYETRLKQISMQKSKLQSSHSRCQEEKRRNIQEIESLRSRIRELESEIAKLRMMSPKESINTRNTLTTPSYNRRVETKMQISRRSEQSGSDSSSYGVNYNNYKNFEENSYQEQEKVYRSSYQTARHNMSGSEVGSIGKATSHQYILGTESRAKDVQHGYNKMQMSSVSSQGNTIGSGGAKRYEMYYESKYEKKQ